MTHPTDTTPRTLPLLNGHASDAPNDAEGCGCGGCGCGASTTETTPSSAAETTVKENDVTTSTYSQSYPVTGMTCGHCVASVTEELEELSGVHDVNVDLVAGGTSTVTVSSDEPLAEDAVRTAVVEAGYQLP